MQYPPSIQNRKRVWRLNCLVRGVTDCDSPGLSVGASPAALAWRLRRARHQLVGPRSNQIDGHFNVAASRLGIWAGVFVRSIHE
jgi:hypothetical protein